MAKNKRDRLKPEGPTWCHPIWNGDEVDRFYAEELRASGYEHNRTIKEATRAWNAYHRPSVTQKDIQINNDLLAPFWVPYIYSTNIHGPILRELCSVVDRLAPSRVLDVGCGVGLDACFLAKQYPKITVHGTDCSQGMIDLSLERARRRRLMNMAFSVVTHQRLPTFYPDERFDFIYAHGSLTFMNVDQLQKQIMGISYLLKAGGVFLCVLQMSVNPHSFLNVVAEMNHGFSLWNGLNGDIRTLRVAGNEVCWSCAFQREG